MGTQKRNRILAILAVSVLALFAGLSGWMIWQNQLPPLALPARIPPRPNAFDTLALAHKKLVKKVGSASINGTWVGAGTGKAHNDFGTREDRVAMVRANTEAIRLIRVALVQEYLAPLNFRFDQLLPQYGDQKELSKILEAAAQLAFEDKQWSVGAEYCCDAIQLGQLISANEYSMGYLVGIACEARCRKLLSEYVDKTPDTDLKLVYERLMSIEGKREHIEIAFENDRIAHQVLIRALANQTPREISDMIGIDDKRAWMIMFSSKRAASAAADRHYEELTRRARLPYNKAAAPIPIPGDPINEALLGDYPPVLFREAQLKAESTVLLAYLWIRLNGPVTELPAQFTDPFGKGAKLQYRKSASTFSVYSVGPDGVDDGGGVINDGFGKVGRIRETSTGDIVLKGQFAAPR